MPFPGRTRARGSGEEGKRLARKKGYPSAGMFLHRFFVVKTNQRIKKGQPTRKLRNPQ